MIFPQKPAAPERVEQAGDKIGVSFAFDFDEGRFDLVDGSPRRISGRDAARQWLELFVRTSLGKYTVYEGKAFGVDVAPLIGKKEVPRGAVLSELKREITEGARLCPAVVSVYGFSLQGDTVNFTVRLQSGEERLSFGL